jgi:hypothetical protein
VSGELVVVGARLDVDVHEVGEVLEDVGHGCELAAESPNAYFIIYNWLFIVRETRFRKVFVYGATTLGLRPAGRFLCLHSRKSTFGNFGSWIGCDSILPGVRPIVRFLLMS